MLLHVFSVPGRGGMSHSEWGNPGRRELQMLIIIFIRCLSCAHAWNWYPRQFPKLRLELHKPLSQAIRTAKLTECIKTICRKQPPPAFLLWDVLLISRLAEALQGRTTVFSLLASNSEVFRRVQKIKDPAFLISLTCVIKASVRVLLYTVLALFHSCINEHKPRRAGSALGNLTLHTCRESHWPFSLLWKQTFQSVAWTLLKLFSLWTRHWEALMTNIQQYWFSEIQTKINACVHFAFTNASPSFEQKDMIADEIQTAKESSHSKVKNLEKLAAKEICCKYLDRKAGHLLEEVAVDFASAICLCLRKKNSNIAEVIF